MKENISCESWNSCIDFHLYVKKIPEACGRSTLQKSGLIPLPTHSVCNVCHWYVSMHSGLKFAKNGTNALLP